MEANNWLIVKFGVASHLWRHTWATAEEETVRETRKSKTKWVEDNIYPKYHKHQHCFLFIAHWLCSPSASSSLFWLYGSWLSQPQARRHFRADSSLWQVTSVDVQTRYSVKLRGQFKERPSTWIAFLALTQQFAFYYPGGLQFSKRRINCL